MIAMSVGIFEQDYHWEKVWEWWWRRRTIEREIGGTVLFAGCRVNMIETVEEDRSLRVLRSFRAEVSGGEKNRPVPI
jgi:hypothetical protein